MIYYIYKLTNTVNGKGYVGFTSKEPERRWQMHLENSQSKRNQYLYDAINKYGWENFTKEVIYCSKEREHALKDMEPYFIREHNTFYMNEHGYNMTLGGDGFVGGKHTDEFKKKRSEKYSGAGNTFHGKHHEDDAKEKIGNAVRRTRHLRVGEKAPNYGKTHTKEIKQQIGDTQAGQWLITFPDGHKERISNLRQFCREHDLNSSNMMAVVAGKQHHHKGFKCERAVGYKGAKTIWVLTEIATGIETEVSNLRAWCRERGYAHGNLWRVAAGKIKQAYGYKCRKL